MTRITNRLFQKNTAERSALSRVDKFFKSGRIIAVNTLTHTAVVQAISGYIDNLGNPINFEAVPYDPQIIPKIGDTVRLSYDGHSPHSMRILGQGLGGQNNQNDINVNGASITVKEIDSAPTVSTKIIRFPNASLTDDGGGQVTVAFPSNSLTVEEQDGTPTVSDVNTIKVNNGSLTDEGGGVVSIDVGAGNAGNSYTPINTPPVAADYTWVNQGSSTVADVSAAGGVKLLGVNPGGTGENARIQVKSVSGNFKWFAKIIPGMGAAGGTKCGILVRDSATGKFLICAVENTSIVFQYYASPTGGVAGIASIGYQGWMANCYIFLDYDGTDIHYGISTDGETLDYVAGSIPRTTYLTNAPDQVGFFANPYAGSSQVGIYIVDVNLI